MPIVSLHMPLPAAPEVPEWVHLVPAGTFRGIDGRGPYTLADAGAVIRACKARGKLPVDENHSIDLAAPKGEPSPARGWIDNFEARDNGIWGHVDWTASGRALMADKSYRGMSPAMEHDASGRVLAVHRASLTNTANLPLVALHNTQDTMDLTQLREALGLPETADLAACVAAASAGQAAIALHAQQIAAIRTAAGVAESVAPDGIVLALQAQRTGASSAEKMAGELVSLQSQLTTLRNEHAREKAEAFLDSAIAAGKPIPEVLHGHYVSRHMADPAAVEKEIGAMVSLHAGGVGNRPAGAGGEPDGDELTEEERTVARRMGQSPKEFAAFKKSKGSRG
jgi:phage I-like protein